MNANSSFTQMNATRRRGFTLTEIAIVLGVIGIILAAIWAAASTVYQNNRTQTAVQEVATIVAGYRSLYASAGVDDPAGWQNVTCKGMINGYFPQQMLTSGWSCANASDGTAPSSYPSHPWGSWVAAYAISNWNPQAVGVLFEGLDQQDCARFAGQMANVPDLVFQEVDSTSVELPPLGSNSPLTSSQVATACSSATDNSVYVMFRAR